MINLKKIERLSGNYNFPIEDVLFIALNFYGVNFACDFNRMRMGLSVTNNKLLPNAFNLGILDFYFALPINIKSPFLVSEGKLFFDGEVIGDAIEPSEDFCDSNYPRRKGTVLNMNPNSRTTCRGCRFCYTAYQVPRDKKRIFCETDIRNFFKGWKSGQDLVDLSHLIQVAVVTGCYNTNNDLKRFLLSLNKVLPEERFNGEIFYLGSQITNKKSLEDLSIIKSFCYCLSLECFERRESLLRDKKKRLSLQNAYELMDFAKRQCGFRVNFSYIIGLESLGVVERYFRKSLTYITSFPIVNTIQIHKYHDSEKLLDPEVYDIEYFLKARRALEGIFLPTEMRPRPWEDYRSLWFLKFGDEVLSGIRTP